MRYQAALRPDITGRIDSKALSNFVTTPDHDFRPRPCTNRAFMSHCTVTVPTDSPLAGSNLAGAAVQLFQSFALHLQFHLRILFANTFEDYDQPQEQSLGLLG